nr:hypothetical protein [Prauserella marina]
MSPSTGADLATEASTAWFGRTCSASTGSTSRPSGTRLAELMVLHNVGVQDESVFVLKKVDEDFFDQP